MYSTCGGVSGYTIFIIGEGSWGSRGKQLSIMDLLGIGAFSRKREDEIRAYFASL